MATTAVFTDAGENLTADLVDNTANMPVGGFWVGWGGSTVAAAAGDTALASERAEARVQATMSQPSANINRAVATITATSTGSVGEAGLFSSSSAGTCIVSGSFDATPVETNDAMQFTFEITWSQ